MLFAPRPVVLTLALLLTVAGCSGPVSGLPGPGVPDVPDVSSVVRSTAPAVSQRTSVSPAPITVPPALPTASSSLSTPGTSVVGSAPSATQGSQSTSVGPGVDGAVGAAGIGDPYYPTAGNGGYQVDAYDVQLSYDPGPDVLHARTTITGSVTSAVRLGRFDLDLQPTMTVSAVTVNGGPAAFDHRAAELMITPATGLAAGSALTVVVSYGGHPDLIAGGTSGGSHGGWYRTAGGGAIAIGEPFSASAWYPVNEHPADPAAFSVTATVPAKWKVISNGVPQTTGLPTPGPGTAVFRWVQRQPIASYLTTIYIDTFSIVEDHLADGRPIISAFAPVPDAARYRAMATDTRRIVEDLTTHFGPYPFDGAGGIYIGEALSFALETTTRPVYPNWVTTDTIVHELAHQWYGDDVTIERWSDICLNECFASYAPWLWHADVDHQDLDEQWVLQMQLQADDPSFWSSPLVGMGPGHEFTAVYQRGPLALHALRKEMGEVKFAALLRDWPRDFGGKNATFDMWEEYVNAVAGRDLTGFIDAWFRGTVIPPEQYRYPGGLGPIR